MNETMQRLMDAQKAAEVALEQAKQATREAALAQLGEAMEACKAAGVRVLDGAATKRAGRRPGFKLSAEQRARASERARNAWANKSPEQRAALVSSIAAQRKANSAASVQ